MGYVRGQFNIKTEDKLSGSKKVGSDQWRHYKPGLSI